MTDTLPWLTTGNLAAVGGWMLLVTFISLVFRALVRGDLVTRREADAKVEENVYLRAKNDHLLEQNGRLVDGFGAVNDSLDAIRRAAERRNT